MSRAAIPAAQPIVAAWQRGRGVVRGRQGSWRCIFGIWCRAANGSRKKRDKKPGIRIWVPWGWMITVTVLLHRGADHRHAIRRAQKSLSLGLSSTKQPTTCSVVPLMQTTLSSVVLPNQDLDSTDSRTSKLDSTTASATTTKAIMWSRHRQVWQLPPVHCVSRKQHPTRPELMHK